jgi:hypothetical protein
LQEVVGKQCGDRAEDRQRDAGAAQGTVVQGVDRRDDVG